MNKKIIICCCLFIITSLGQNLTNNFLLNENNFVDDNGAPFTLYAPSEVDLTNSFFDRIMGLNQGLRTYSGRKMAYQRVILKYLLREKVAEYQFVEKSLVSDLTKVEAYNLITSTGIELSPTFSELFSKLKFLKYTKNVDFSQVVFNKFKSNLREIRHGTSTLLKYFSATLSVLDIALEADEYIQTRQKIAQFLALSKALQYDRALADITELESLPNSDPAFRNAIEEIKIELNKTDKDAFSKLFNEINSEIKRGRIGQAVNISYITNDIVTIYATFAGQKTLMTINGWVFAAVFLVETSNLIQEHNDYLKDAIISTTLYQFYYQNFKVVSNDDLRDIKLNYIEFSYWDNLMGAFNNGYYDFLKWINSDWDYWLKTIQSSKEEALKRMKNRLIDLSYQKFLGLKNLDNNQNKIINIVIFDNSGSMSEKSKFSNLMKIDEAKTALKDIVQNSSDNFDWTLLAFNNCSVDEIISNSANKNQIINEVEGFSPYANTPLGYSLKRALDIYKNNLDYEKVSIILITDGVETCSKGLPETVAAEIKKYVELDEEIISFNGILYKDVYADTKYPPLNFFIVGFTTDDAQNQTLNNLAQIGGGKFFTAANLPELKENLKEIVESIEGKSAWLWSLIPTLFVLLFIVGLLVFMSHKKSNASNTNKISTAKQITFQLIDLYSQKIFIGNKNGYKIGRLASNDLVLNQKTISKIHAEIHFDEIQYGYVIKNISKINPIKINGIRKSESLLNNGDIINVAQYKFKFSVK
ncbi:MAG: FHA domain-containing protein [Ignavibacteriales bacterium]|nr:FHA domain-containing protein [Ignavibacteriales bacterium]